MHPAALADTHWPRLVVGVGRAAGASKRKVGEEGAVQAPSCFSALVGETLTPRGGRKAAKKGLA